MMIHLHSGLPVFLWSKPVTRQEFYPAMWISLNCMMRIRFMLFSAWKPGDLSAKGEGWKLALTDTLTLKGKLPISTMGVKSTRISDWRYRCLSTGGSCATITG
ncbi:MAG: hypothetical protein MZV70_46525 [Desulfobacterales bacterium]|nr:hypothetical protein [Desulfobacterales bacterium]